jgi:hypothetical protein
MNSSLSKHFAINPLLKTTAIVIELLDLHLDIEHQHSLKFSAPFRLDTITRPDRAPTKHRNYFLAIPRRQKEG